MASSVEKLASDDLDVDADMMSLDGQSTPNVAPNSEINGKSPIVEYVLGVDFGTETAIVCLLPLKSMKPDLLRNDLSNEKTPVIISFHESVRSFGDVALQLQTTQKHNTFSGVLRAIGKSKDEFLRSTPFFTANATEIENQVCFVAKHTYADKSQNEDNVAVEKEIVLTPEEVIAMFFEKFASFLHHSEEIKFNKSNMVMSVVVPETFGEKEKNAIYTAAKIADIDLRELITRTSAAVVTHGTRKSFEVLKDRVTMFVDIGHGYASVAIYKYFSNNQASAEDKLALEKDKNAEHLVSECDAELGSYVIDELLFDELVKEVKEKHNYIIDKNSKGAIRLRTAAKSLKESLSGVPEANATCENLMDGQDIKFSLTRDKFDEICRPLKEKLEQLLLKAINKLPDDIEINSIELIGGGMRVPLIKDTIINTIKSHEKNHEHELSYTLDSMAANAVGACYNLARKFEPKTAIRRPIFETILKVKDDFGTTDTATLQLTLNEQKFASAKILHTVLSENDTLVKAKNESRNEFERFIFEMKAAAQNPKNSGTIKKDSCLELLDEAESWMYSDEAESAVDKTPYQQKLTKLKEDLEDSCGAYWKEIKEKTAKMETELNRLSAEKKAEEEGVEKDDHDFRKLSKPERMKKVSMNKDEGNSLFKDGNVEAASLRYKRALQHCDKFFDLNADDKKEINEIKISLWLNLAMCEIKLEKFDFALQNLNKVMETAENGFNEKGLYRRAVVYEQLKDFEKAKKDLMKVIKKREDNGEEEDKAVGKLMQRVDLQIKKQKAKQKKMAQKMFS